MLTRTLVCLSPEPGDSDEVRQTKKDIRYFLDLHLPGYVEAIRLALSPKARKDNFGRPYLPSEDEKESA
jgi:hypothetical protein